MLTLDAVNEVLDRLVAEKGSTRFMRNADGCYYRKPDGEPLCIVGHVLAELEPEFFRGLNTEKHGLNGTNFDALLDMPAVELEDLRVPDDVRKFLTHVQSEQDSSKDWETSVLAGRNRLAMQHSIRLTEH